MAINFTRIAVASVIIVLGVVLTERPLTGKEDVMDEQSAAEIVQLPKPVVAGGVSLEQALLNRRSQRDFIDHSLTLEQVARILWAAHGVTHARGFRTVPSAGALYPLEVYLVCGRTEGLDPGVYLYDPKSHQLRLVKAGDHRPDLCRSGLSQSPIATAAVSFVITGIAGRTTAKYGERGKRYVLMEAGHAGQNLLLEAESLGLGAVPVGAFKDGQVHRLLELDREEQPLYIIPVGYPAD